MAEQGADVPDWMLDWPISHPGFSESTQLEDRDIEALCRGVRPLDVAEIYVEGEERIMWDFAIKEYAIPAEETTYVDIRFNFPVRTLTCGIWHETNPLDLYQIATPLAGCALR